MAYGALVLLGNSGVGKDTIAEILCAEYAKVVNVKFSELTKTLLADLLRVDRAMFEDREWRSTQKLSVRGKETNITPLSLLNALYFGAQKSGIHQDNIDYTLGLIGDNFPVFTDIRRNAEFKSIEHLNPLVIRLVSSRAPGTLTDEEQDLILDDACLDTDVLTRTQVVNIINNKVEHLQKHKKPTLHVYVGLYSRQPEVYEPFTRGYPLYDPFVKILSKTMDYLEDIGCIPLYAPAVVENLLNNNNIDVNFKQLALEDFKGSRALNFYRFHVPLLDNLRSRFYVKVHLDTENVREFALQYFTDKEIV